MGQLLSRNLDKPRVQRSIDRIFYEVADIDGNGPDGKPTLNFAELYIAVLLVYNDINKVFTNFHSEPPKRAEVMEMLKTFDTHKNGVLDRKEFEAFVLKFTDGASKQIGVNLLVVCVLVPGLVHVTKKFLKPVDTVGLIVEKVPGAVFAVGYMMALSAVGLKMH